LKQSEWMTVKEFCDEIGISRRTWESWRTRGVTPRFRKLFNGRIVILRADADAWFDYRPHSALGMPAPTAFAALQPQPTLS
jgi:hypothetical protein